MHKQVIIRNKQEIGPTDLNDLQNFAQATLDDLTRDAITTRRVYSGFTVTQVSALEVNVAPGRLYDTGRQYINEAITPFNLTSSVPVATKRKIAIVAYAETKETDVQERDFEIDVETNNVQPQAVPMQELRFANLDKIAGVEGADPQPPATGANTLVVAYITLGTTGVLSIEMVAANRLENLDAVAGRVTSLEGWRNQAGTRLETLATDLSNIANRQTDTAHGVLLEALAFDVARMRTALDLPSTYTAYGSDAYHTTEQSDLVKVGYSAKIEEGLTFANDAEDVRLVSVFNPFDSNVKVHAGGLVLPSYTHQRRIEVPGYSGARSLTEYPSTTWALVKKTLTRHRRRWGNRYKDTKVTSTTQVLRRTAIGPNAEPIGSDYPVEPILFKLSTEADSVFKTEIKRSGRVQFNARRNRYRQEVYTEPYWTAVRSDVAVDGSLRAQSFLNAQDGWITRLGLHFTQLAATGDVRIAVCELTESGTPDRQAVISEVTLARSAMKVYPQETVVDIGPAYLRAGRRYAIMLLSQAAHQVAMGDQLSYSGGAFFHSIDGAYFTGDQTDDLKFNVYYASFDKTWVQVQLAPMSLSGGISDIDLVQEGWTPETCSLTYEVQKSGGQWVAIDSLPADATAGPLMDLPALMNFRAVFSGTPDVMPGINLAKTEQRLSRPKTAFTHFSKQFPAFPASSSTIKVKCVLASYVEANHDFTVNLLCGPAGATVETPDVIADKPLDGGLIERTFTFLTAAAQTQIVVKGTGATVAATDTFAVQSMTFVAT